MLPAAIVMSEEVAEVIELTPMMLVGKLTTTAPVVGDTVTWLAVPVTEDTA